ncbi:MAG: hypothetical protein GTO02_09310 [Candidatus Dadabacteria bacterium]|nr:hypothetical protein [Candidatus Dadabacteria bacterium]
MGILYSVINKDDDYDVIDVDFEHLGVKKRHPFDIPIPETPKIYINDYMHIHDGKDYGFTILNKNKSI